MLILFSDQQDEDEDVCYGLYCTTEVAEPSLESTSLAPVNKSANFGDGDVTIVNDHRTVNHYWVPEAEPFSPNLTYLKHLHETRQHERARNLDNTASLFLLAFLHVVFIFFLVAYFFNRKRKNNNKSESLNMTPKV